MRKSTLLKLALVFTALIMFAGANAQILTDYQVATGIQSIDSVVTGTTTRIYVLPDPVYSPGYVGAANAPIGAGQRWTWYNSNNGTAPVIKALSADNWIERTWGAVGSYNVSVVESNGFCTSGSFSAIVVDILAAPTVTFTSVDAPGTVFGSAGSPFSLCENDTRLTTDVPQAAFTSSISVIPSYQLQYTVTVEYTTNAGTTWTNIPALGEAYSGAAGTQKTSINTATYNIAAPAGGYIAYNVAGIKYPTRYTYSINGMTDRITRKCDYLTNPTKTATAWTWYDTTAETLVITVNPTPVTGPIYHIPNTWSL